MTRIRFSEDENYNNAAILWEANQERSLKSKRGQAALRRLEAALLALPEKKLVADAIETADGLVCGLGALAKHEHYEGSLELPSWPGENATDEQLDEWDYANEEGLIEDAMLSLAAALNVPRLVAVAIIHENDDGDYGAQTPEGRYNHVLKWTQRWITRDCSTWTTKSMEGYVE